MRRSLLVWGMGVAAFLWFFRGLLGSPRLVPVLWTLGAVLFFAGIVVDFGFRARFEDALEIAATCAFLAGFTALAFDRVVGEVAQDLLDPRENRRGGAELPAPRARRLERSVL